MIQVYSDVRGQWRWRFVSSNGQTTASSGESFASKRNAKRAARAAGLRMATAKVVEVR